MEKLNEKNYERADGLVTTQAKVALYSAIDSIIADLAKEGYEVDEALAYAKDKTGAYLKEVIQQKEQ